MMFLSRLFSQKSGPKSVAARLFDQLNRQSRQIELFAEGRVPDTFEGRFEAVTLHAAILMRRLKVAGPSGARAAQKLFENIFSNFDYAFREAGVGDLIVGKKMRKLAEGFYGRIRAYESAFDVEGNVSEVISRNLMVDASEEDLRAATRYTEAAVAALDAQSEESLFAGELHWPAATEFFSG